MQILCIDSFCGTATISWKKKKSAPNLIRLSKCLPFIHPAQVYNLLLYCINAKNVAYNIFKNNLNFGIEMSDYTNVLSWSTLYQLFTYSYLYYCPLLYRFLLYPSQLNAQETPLILRFQFLKIYFFFTLHPSLQVTLRTAEVLACDQSDSTIAKSSLSLHRLSVVPSFKTCLRSKLKDSPVH